MAKNWEKVEITVDKNGKAILAPVSKKENFNKKVKKLNLHTIKTLSFEDLKKEGDKAFTENSFKEDSIVEAYNNKKIKSKSLIVEAKSIIKKREKEAEKKQKKAAQQARRDKITDTNTAIM